MELVICRLVPMLMLTWAHSCIVIVVETFLKAHLVSLFTSEVIVVDQHPADVADVPVPAMSPRAQLDVPRPALAVHIV